MHTDDTARARLLQLLQTKSVFYGDFTLASGAKSNYYIDCRLTTLDGEGASLVGQVMHALIMREAASRRVTVDAVGGLTLGADPVALAVGMRSFEVKDNPPLRTFVVRKAQKVHGQGKLIEGNFKPGDRVVVVDDVVTKGESTLTAIRAIEQDGGKVLFAAALVDRQQGGREHLQEHGHTLVAAFVRDEIVRDNPR